MIWTNTVRDEDGGTFGFDSVADFGVSKNGITVGAVNDIVGGYTQPSDVQFTAFSCFGPTDDGRIKPDVMANGLSVMTPIETGVADYDYDSGTSYAAPTICGSAGLLVSLQSNLHGTNAPFWASTIKGLIIHTADEAGVFDGPDYRYGWGLANFFKAAEVMTNNASWDSRPHIKEVTLPDGDYIEFEVLADSSQELRVTICWTDPPGPIQSWWLLDPTNSVLVNDLDLRLISPNGATTNKPWILDPTNEFAMAPTGDDSRGNVEQVHIDSPTTGWYTLQVTHKGSLTNGQQDVSIIITGNTPSNAPPFEITEIETDRTNQTFYWSGVVGDIHRIMTKDDLLSTNVWGDASDDFSVTKDVMTWRDDDYYGTNAPDSQRFYKVNEVE